jgi:hypothetical protein
VARGLELVDALPSARAHALRGTFMILGLPGARLAGLLRAGGRKDEAEKLEAVVDRLWLKADPGLREAVKKMR